MPKSRVLVLCIDRDDDVGVKAKIQSPVIGRAACLDAARELGLSDPEDSDLNAIYGAINTFDRLQEKGEDSVIALIAGSSTNMIEGDRKIGQHLDKIIGATGVDSCILVTDGAEDEFILPIIQSRLKISSIRRIIVSQMPDLEGTYYILKKFMEDPKVAKTVLVPIGLAMLLFAITNLLGYPEIAVVIVVGALGIWILFKGMGIDEVFGVMLTSLKVSLRRGRFTFVSYIAAILLLIVGIIMGLTSILVHYTSTGILQFVLMFSYGAVGWITSAGIIAAIGKIIDVYMNEREFLGRVIVMPFFLFAIGAIIYGISVYILSISNVPMLDIEPSMGIQYIIISIIGGIACSLIGMYVQSITSKWVGERNIL